MRERQSNFKFKLIQSLNAKRKEGQEGFTLVELLVVIIIIGILAAIALPNFLNQGAKAKQTEAKQNIGVILRTQTAHRAENTSFANSFDALGIGSLSGSGTTSTTTNYSYVLASGGDSATITATARDTGLKGYAGRNQRFTNSASLPVLDSQMCEASNPGTATVNAPTFSGTAISCGSGTVALGT